MAHSLTFTSFRTYQLRITWVIIEDIYHLLSNRDDLSRLIRWATAKHLVKPRRLYQNRLADVEMRLSRHALRSPTLMFWMELLYTCFWLAKPKRPYFPKGSAAKYKKTGMVG